MARLNQPVDRTGSRYISINPYYINVPEQQDNISKKLDENKYVPGTPSKKFDVLTNRPTIYPHYRQDVVPNSHLYPNIKTTYMKSTEDTMKFSRLLNNMDNTPFYIGMKRYDRTSLPYKMPAQSQ
jgi:hypothetical protein